VSGIAMGSAMRERFARLVRALGMGIAATGAWMLVTI
jgi:hydrogenase/urease accessory protein HupE